MSDTETNRKLPSVEYNFQLLIVATNTFFHINLLKIMKINGTNKLKKAKKV